MIEVSPDLLAFLRDEETRSRNEDLLDRAEVALDSYNGAEYGDEEEGRSKVVTRDVAEVIDQMEISVLRVFVSGDRVVEFEPTDESQEQAADDATETIHRQFARKGYQLLHDWFKEGNLSTVGIVKSCVERKRKRVESIVPEVLIPDHAIEAEPVPDDDSGLSLHRVITLEEGEPEFKDYLVPLEEYRGNLSAYRDLDELPYQAHVTPKTLSELVEMGFEREDIDDLTSTIALDQLANARGEVDWRPEGQGALRRVLLIEEYARFDANDDGIAELLCIHRVGDTILRIEECDYHPFSIYCPFPMPGRIAGQSLAEKVTDLQRISTVILRGYLDGQYCNLAPGYIVPDGAVNENTYDDLLTVRPNRIIRTTGQAEITPEVRNDTSQSSLAALEYLYGLREQRTGITRLNQGLDADTLNKTATGAALISAAGQQMEEYLARNFGEAVARLMRLKLKMHSRYGQPSKMRVDGVFREVDPSQWPEEMDVIIRVGLGSGRKEQRLNNRMMLLQIQREVMMAGLPIVTPDHIHKSIAGVVKDASLGSPADFVADPASPEVQERMAQPPEPSPEEKKMQAEMQLQAAKLQGEQQMGAAKLEQMREEAALKARLARDEAEAEAGLAAAKANAEMELARAKFEFEKEIAVEKLAFEERRAAREADRRDHETETKLSQQRPGGKLDE